MNISSFFIEAADLWTVLAILITAAGILAMPVLPISEYPEIVPPHRGGQRPVSRRVAENHCRDCHHPLEQQIKRRRECDLHQLVITPDGNFTITVTFRLEPIWTLPRCRRKTG